MQKPLAPELVYRLNQQFGEDTAAEIMAGMTGNRTTSFRVNTLKTTDEAVEEALTSQDILFKPVPGIPHAYFLPTLSSHEALRLDICQHGHIYLQGISSMIPPILLNPQPGETILDLCAAPGSKTSQLAALSGDEAHIIAMEINQIRFDKLKYTLDRQGVEHVDAQKGDAKKLTRALHGTCDAVLADVPCTAEGRMNLKKEKTHAYWSKANTDKHVALQRNLIAAAVPCLKPGGRLVYSTCTLEPRENEEMITWISETYPHMETVALEMPIPSLPANGGAYLLPSRKQEGLFVAMLVNSKRTL